jgi:beta-lactamase regulating signal transducer with metallopeptidase domain
MTTIAMPGSLLAISQTAAAALFAGLWQGALLAVALGLAMRVAPRISAAVRFAVWMAAFLAIALLPLLAAFRASGAPQPASRPAIHPLQLDSRWALGIVAAWAIFAAARLASLARNAFRLRALRDAATPATMLIQAAPRLAALLANAGRRRARLCASAEIDQPCAIGFFAPRVLVPFWLIEKATPAELEQIVLHEVSHLRRFDDWTNLLQKLAVAVFPLNPALLWVERRLCAAREVACDESVVRATQAPRAYAACLASLAEQRLNRVAAALSLGAWGRRSQLAGRIESILRGGSQLGRLQAGAVTAALVLATVGGALKLGDAAPLISFAAPRQNAVAALNSAPLAGTGASSRGVYHDVVFREPAVGGASSVRSSSGVPQPCAQLATAKFPEQAPRPVALRSIAKRSPRSRMASRPGGIQSFLIVTRWQDSSGGQLTVIDHVVRLSAAQLSAGWFVVQL